MPGPHLPYQPPRRHARRFLLTLSLLTALPLTASAQLPLAGPAPPLAPQGPVVQVPPQTAPVVGLTLGDCLHLAAQRQPRLAAARASLAAAQDGARALENLNAPGLIAPELPIRRRQAALGVTAAAAALDQAERETAYAVTRTYFTVLYAREQETVTRNIVERLTAVRDTVKQQVEGGAREYTETDVKKSSSYVHLAVVKRIQASQGVNRALAALREAIGLCPGDHLAVAPAGLPEAVVRPCREEVVAAALARRAELVRAGVFADVACLEIEAQGTGVHKKLETFAAGSDIHAAVIPQGVQNTEYRPGGLLPEYPTLLAGCRPDRVKRAQSLHARAQAVTEVARNLVALEAEDAFLRWEEAALQTPEAKAAADAARDVADELSKGLTAKLKVKVDEVLSARVLNAQAQAQYNESLYRQILALADLERITGGAFCAHLVEAAATRK
jgi:outer membrane protein TolC